MSAIDCFALLLASLAVSRAQQFCTEPVKKSCNAAVGASACIIGQCSSQTSEGDAEFERTMTEGHNEVRAESCFGVYGANMLEMQWNSELEDNALRWLQNLCEEDGFSHDDYSCRQTPSFDAVGQNLWWSTEEYSSISEAGGGAIQSWHAEKNLTKTVGELIPYAFNEATAHYTQMIWADSYVLGCAYLMKPQTSSRNMTWVACNYAKGGNVVGEGTFQASDTLGSNCTSGSSTASSGLCAVCDIDEVNAVIGLKPTP